MEDNKLKWIHLSDIHYNYKNYDTIAMRNKLYKYLEEITDNTIYNFLVITGDISYKFGKMDDNLINDLSRISKISKNNIYMVVGNHDIKRTKVREAVIDSMKKEDIRNVYVSNLDKDTYNELVKGQKRFWKYYNDNLNPEKYDYKKLHIIIEREKYNIICMNTCFFSGQSREEGNLILGLRNHIEILNQLNKNDGKINIAIGHHGIDCFNECERNSIVNNFIDNGIDLYMCGHVHNGNYKFYNDDLRELPVLTSGSLMLDGYSKATFITGEIDLSSNQSTVQYHSWITDIQNWDVDNNIGRKLKNQRLEFTLDRLKSTSSTNFINNIDETIKMIANKKILKSSFQKSSKYFTGRDSYIDKIEILWLKTSCIVLNGIGGIGKSEIAKKYAEKYGRNYDILLFAYYEDSIMNMINNDVYIPISNLEKSQNNNPNEYYETKISALQDLCNAKVLLIIDGMNNNNDINLNKILNLNCRKLITTRCDFSEISLAKQIFIDKFDNFIDAENLFYHYYRKKITEDEKEIINQLITKVNCHTITLELIAKCMIMATLSAVEMLARLKKSTYIYPEEKVKIEKYGVFMKESVNYIIQEVFSLTKLSDSEKLVLSNMSLVPYSGIDTKRFKEYCNFKTYDDINNLVDNGWIIKNEELDTIALHQVISDVIIKKLQPNVSKCKNMLLNFTNCITSEEKMSLQAYIQSYEWFSVFDNRVIIDDYGFYNLLLLDMVKHCVDFGDRQQAFDIVQKVLTQEIDDERILLIAHNLKLTILLEFAKYTEAEKEIEIIENQFSKALQEDLILTLDFMENKGWLYIQTKDYEGIKYGISLFEEGINIAHKSIGIKSKKLDRRYANLYYCKGVGLFTIGEYEEALQIQKLALELKAAAFGGDYAKETFVCRQQIGAIFLRKNQYKQALTIFNKLLQLKLQNFSKDAITIALTYDSLALCHHKLYESNQEHDLKLAKTYSAEAIRICMKNKNEARYIRCCNGMILICKSLKQIEEALSWINKILDNYENNSNFQGEIAKVFENRATIFMSMGSLNEEAIRDLTKAHDIYTKIKGLNHVDTKNIEHLLKQLNKH